MRLSEKTELSKRAKRKCKCAWCLNQISETEHRIKTKNTRYHISCYIKHINACKPISRNIESYIKQKRLQKEKRILIKKYHNVLIVDAL